MESKAVFVAAVLVLALAGASFAGTFWLESRSDTTNVSKAVDRAAKALTNPIEKTMMTACTDSDGGKNTIKQGVTYGCYPTVFGDLSCGEATDSCYGSDSVFEYYCMGKSNYLNAEEMKCASNHYCADGACVSCLQLGKACTDDYQCCSGAKCSGTGNKTCKTITAAVTGQGTITGAMSSDILEFGKSIPENSFTGFISISELKTVNLGRGQYFVGEQHYWVNVFTKNPKSSLTEGYLNGIYTEGKTYGIMMDFDTYAEAIAFYNEIVELKSPSMMSFSTAKCDYDTTAKTFLCWVEGEDSRFQLMNYK